MSKPTCESSLSHVAIVRELDAAFRKGDIGAILAVLSPDVEWGEPDNPFNPAAGTRCGHTGFLEWLRIGRESEEIVLLEVRQFLGEGETVAVVGHTKCRAKSTGRTYETDFVHLVTLRDGLIVRCQEFFDTFAGGPAFRIEPPRTPTPRAG